MFSLLYIAGFRAPVSVPSTQWTLKKSLLNERGHWALWIQDNSSFQKKGEYLSGCRKGSEGPITCRWLFCSFTVPVLLIPLSFSFFTYKTEKRLVPTLWDYSEKIHENGWESAGYMLALLFICKGDLEITNSYWMLDMYQATAVYFM